MTQHAAELARGMLRTADLPEAGFQPDLREAVSRLERWRLVTAEEDPEGVRQRTAAEDSGSESMRAGSPTGKRLLHAVKLEAAPGLLRDLRAEWLRMERHA